MKTLLKSTKKDILKMQFEIDLNNDNQKGSKNTQEYISARNFVTIDYNPFDLETKVAPRVIMLDCMKKSIKLDSHHFTNMLPDIENQALESHIELALEKMKENPGILFETNNPIRYSGKNKERIEELLTKYVSEDEFNKNCDYFRKSDVKTDALLENRGSFRVIGLYTIKPKTHPKQKHSKHYLNVILLDPYHLFIPGKHNGLTAEEYKIKVYSEVSENTKHIGDYY